MLMITNIIVMHTNNVLNIHKKLHCKSIQILIFKKQQCPTAYLTDTHKMITSVVPSVIFQL